MTEIIKVIEIIEIEITEIKKETENIKIKAIETKEIIGIEKIEIEKETNMKEIITKMTLKKKMKT